MQRFASIGLLVTLVAALAVPASALDLKSLKPQGYVSDFAGVVDAESRTAIENYAAAVERATGAQMSFITLKTLDDQPLEDVSIDLFRQFGVGQKGKDNGVQLLLVTGDHRSRLEVGNGLEALLPDGLDGQILLEMRPELQAGHYGHALLIAAQRIGQAVAQGKGVSAVPPPAAVVKPDDDPPQTHNIPWPLIFYGIAILAFFLLRGSRGGRGGSGGGGGIGNFVTGMVLGNLLGGGLRGSGRYDGGGGGFGGSGDGGGSSGGFGGFGGGDAGGGGASSSW